ncbi:hypothetical protein MHU86_8414 [Fragilaria crotonensis]|nr:hypothetical protein MHU86_8414 [Fragilaria crotonensis]
MASAYAQSSKLFAEMRSSKVVNCSTPRENRFGAIATAHRKRTNTSIANMSLQGASGPRDAGERHEVSWLNRVNAGCHPVPPVRSRPGTIECMEDIHMSQMTDDFSSQHSDQHAYTMGLQNKSVASNHQTDYIPRFHHATTPMTRALVASRFHHLSVPLERIADPASTPRANISVASSRTPYRPRCGTKIRSWTDRFNPRTPARAVHSSTKHEPKSIDLSTKPALHDAHPVRFATNNSETPGPCARSTAAKDAATSRQFTMLDTTSSGKIINDHLKKLDEKAASIQAMVASSMHEIAEGRKSALGEIDKVMRSATSGLDDKGNDKIRQLEAEASALRQQNEREATGFFQKQRTLFIDACMPFLQEKVTSMIASVLGHVTNKVGIERTSYSPVEASAQKERTKSSALVVVESPKPTVTNLKNPSPVVDVRTPRRSKREASKRNPFCPPVSRSQSASNSTRHRKGKPIGSEKKVGRITSTVTYLDDGPESTKHSDEKGPLITDERKKDPVTIVLSTPKKRKKVFGRPGACLRGVNVSPEQSQVSCRKRPRIHEDCVSVKNKDEEVSNLVTNLTTPKVAIWRRKADFKAKPMSQNWGPALIEDTFEFNF